MTNKNLKKKTIRLTAGVVALTTLAPLVNPIIPSFSNINQNKALAADEETGRVIYTNPNPNGTKDAQGTINNAISKIEILDGENEYKKILKISIADDVEIRKGDKFTLKTEGPYHISTYKIRYNNNVIATATNITDNRESTAPDAVFNEMRSWEEFMEYWNKFKNSDDKAFEYGHMDVVFDKNIEEYNKNRYVKIPLERLSGTNFDFYYKDYEISRSKIETMKNSIAKYTKIITPDNIKENIFVSKPLKIGFDLAESYYKQQELGDIRASSVHQGSANIVPEELKAFDSRSVFDNPEIGKYPEYNRILLKDSEIGKRFLNKGTIFNLKLENTYYTSEKLYNKKVGDIVEDSYITVGEPSYVNAFKDSNHPDYSNRLTPLYRFVASNQSQDKVRFKVLKNDDTGISLELLQDLDIKASYRNHLTLNTFRLNKTKDNLIDLVGESKYIEFLENKTQKELVNNNAKATLTVVEPGQQEKTLGSVSGEKLVKHPELAYGENTRGTIKVRYIDDRTGQEIKETETLYDRVIWKTKYKITPPKISLYKFKEADRRLQGLVGDGEKTITLRYESVSEDELATITVNYVDEQGQKLQESTSIRKEKGEDYTIDKPTIKNYVFKESSKPLTGTLNENTEINLVYKKGTQTLTVKHIDIDTGAEIADKVSDSKEIGYKYTISPLQHEKYDYVEASESLTGSLDTDKEITLKYHKKSKTITVNYVDEKGNKIKDPSTLTKKIDEEYNIEKPEIQNYTFKSSSKPLTGTITDNDEINLVYSKNQFGLTVKHIDIDTGAEIADKVSETKEVGYAYTITPLQHEKYDYVEASESLTGNLESNKEITLKYRKKSKTITVNYVDEQGNKIKDPSTLTKKIDEEYNIEKPEIQNYTFKSSSKPLTGTITDNDNITLTYSKDEKTLTVKYIHRSDNGEVEIKESKTERLVFDKDYSVDKPEIAGYKFKEADSDLTGKLTDNKVIKLYYSKYVPGPEGDKGEPGDKGQPGDKGDKGESGKDNGGSPGRESETPDIRIDPKTGNWIVNGKDTGISVFVKNGKDGKDGKDGNTDYNKVYIHYVDYNGNKTKDSEAVDKNKLQDKLKEQNPQIAKEKDGNIIVVDKDKNKDNKDNKADNIIKYNIVSDKGEELLASIYLPSKSEKPKPEIKGYKYLKTEKVSDNEERVIYTKDGEKSKDQITGDITYRLVDENNKPITTVYYQNDKFQPELDGYVFKEKIKVSDKEYVLVYNKTKSENKDIVNKEDTKTKDTENKNKETNNLTDKELSSKLKSIIKDEDGNVLDTQELEKDVHPTIDGYKYKETKEIDKETQELIYTKDKVELKKADVKTGIENVSGSLFALFGTLILGGLALMFKRKTK